MKFAAATTILFTTLALANPAPVARPNGPAVVETRDQLSEALAPRAEAPALAPEIDARAAGIHLDSRDPKKSKPKTNNGNNTNSSAVSLSPSRALELSALGLGFMEFVRLWI